MGKTRKKAGKTKKKIRRRREYFARTHDKDGKYSLYTPFKHDRVPESKELTPVFIDVPKMSAEVLRLRAAKRAKEAREKIEREKGEKR